MKIKLDENLPVRLVSLLAGNGHDVDTVPFERLEGKPDEIVWQAATREGRFLITQDLDFSDLRRFVPGSHPGLLLLRLREPGAGALLQTVGALAAQLPEWAGCFVVATEQKVRVRRP